MSGYEVRAAAIGRMLVSNDSKAKRIEYLLSDNTAPSAEIIAREPVGTVWFKATPAVGDTTFFQKTPAGTLGEGGTLA